MRCWINWDDSSTNIMKHNKAIVIIIVIVATKILADDATYKQSWDWMKMYWILIIYLSAILQEISFQFTLIDIVPVHEDKKKRKISLFEVFYFAKLTSLFLVS